VQALEAEDVRFDGITLTLLYVAEYTLSLMLGNRVVVAKLYGSCERCAGG